MRVGRPEGVSIWAIAIVGLAAAVELTIRESVHRIGGQVLPMSLLILITTGLIVLEMLLSRSPGQSRLVAALLRLPLTVMVVAFVELLFGGASGPTVQVFGATISIPRLSWLMAGLGAAICIGASPVQWIALRRALAAAALLFVGAQPLLVALHAPTLMWPPQLDLPTPKTAQEPLTVVVLLDEWNAKAAPPIESALRHAGLSTVWKPVQPVGDATSKVVPALFSGHQFDAAKPCSFSAVCSSDQVLDFGQIQASRPDVDIVGFYHPYCDIRGLRWCYRGAVRLDFTSTDRWRCAIKRRTGWPLGVSDELCDRTIRAKWNAMTEEVLDAVWRAPGWTQGGWMFLHLPIPHPPGRLHRRGLTENYQDGIQRAAETAERMARLALQHPARRITFVFFSDHPLRQALWCVDQWVFSSLGCQVDPALVDRNVPLLVAGNRELPALDDYDTNRDVFRVGLAPESN